MDYFWEVFLNIYFSCFFLKVKIQNWNILGVANFQLIFGVCLILLIFFCGKQ